MSDIKWCDIGGHAFSTNDPDRKSYVDTTVNENRERIDICGPCVKSNRMGAKPLSIAATEAVPEDSSYAAYRAEKEASEKRHRTMIDPD